VGRLHLDAVVKEEFLTFAASSGKGLVDLASNSSDPADALVAFIVQPGATCVDGGDRLTLAIDVRVLPPATARCSSRSRSAAALKACDRRP
jgi:hypothetical protein